MRKITFIGTLFLTLLFLGCSGSDSDSSSNQSIHFKFNGDSVNATVTSSVLYKSPETDEKMLQINAETSDKVFQMTFFTTYTADDTIPTGNYITDENVDDGYVYVSYKISGNTYGVHFPDNGTLTVNSSNSGAKKVSGTFHQVLHAIGETEDFVYLGVNMPYEINITDGVFNNITYEVVNVN